MKIAFTSDLHLDFNRESPVEELLLEVLHENKVDRLFIAGDISNTAAKSLNFIQRMNDAGIQTAAVFGNHDYYYTDDFHAQRQAQNVFPCIIDDIGIIGDTGWYDYSWHYTSDRRQIQRGKYANYGYTWPDHRYITWPDDREGDSARWFTKYCLAEMQRQNDQLDQQGIRRKIVMLHMVPHEKLLEWNFHYQETNAFFGAARTQNWIENIRPELVVFGHTHFAKDQVIDDIHYVCRPLGYNMEWPMDRSLKEHIANMLYILDTEIFDATTNL